MSGILTLSKGSPYWWNSPDIWVLPHGSPSSGPPGSTPVAGQPYDVYVRVHNLYSESTDPNWNLFVQWAIPTAGNIPVTAADFLNGIVSGGVANGLPVGIVAATSHSDVKCATTWVPVFENGGHECLIAVVYNSGSIGSFPVEPGGPLGSLNGDASGNLSWSIAQHNLGVLMPSGHPIRYPFRISKAAATRDGFTVVAWEAPLSGIAAFLASVPGGETVLRHPGKVEHLGIVPSAKPDAREIEAARPRLEAVKIPSDGHCDFTLCGIVREGNVLINVTQHLHGRVIGGLSLLVLADTK